MGPHAGLLALDQLDAGYRLVVTDLPAPEEHVSGEGQRLRCPRRISDLGTDDAP